MKTAIVVWMACFTCICATNARSADYAETVRATRGLLVQYRFEESAARHKNHDADIVLNSATAERSDTRDAKLSGNVERGVDSAFASLGKAIRLSGGGHLRVPELGNYDAVSIELWVRVAKPPAEGIAALYAADSWQSSFVHFNLKSSGVLELAINGAESFAISEPDAITADRWSHVVTTYDRASGVTRLFRDGRMIVETTSTAALPIALKPASIGVWINGALSRRLEADLDEFAIYSTALTPAQVRAHYFAAKGVSPKPVDFASRVQPILAKRCHGCHGPQKQESELRLDIRDWAFRGGESGEPAIAPYDAERSHLVQLVSSKNEASVMPPEGDPLSTEEISVLRDWIDQGAPWPDALAGHAPVEKVTTTHWSFQPLKKPAVPFVDAAHVESRNPIDAYIQQALADHQLSPSPATDRRTLIRRLYLDVVGLPPTPEEIQAFANDASPTAWEDLVDHTLASPRYGERWASHWLDVIRYGDTHGFEVNTPRDNAWPYRDYVIRSLNDDKPYNQFIREQVAGDQLGVGVGTGFLVAAPALLSGQVGRDEPSIRLARADELHEAIVSVGSGVLGLTIGCARCHNHKFDPVSQRDHYQLQAIFAGLQYGDRAVAGAGNLLKSGTAKPATMQPVFAGNFMQPGATFRLFRGDPMQRRERVPPDAPAVFGSIGLDTTSTDAQRRLGLANFLVDAQKNPLTARVIVNRVWQHHFGTGLVATPSDFGAMGAKPTHPELLDYLAASLVEGGWSLKGLHRMILTSSTYRQSNRPNDAGLARDAGSLLLWRFPPRRMEMESIRDSILATSGVLDLTMGGPGFMVFKQNSNYVRVYDPKEDWGPGEWRRMVYAHRVRMAQDGVFGAFDCPDAGQPAPRRGRSTTAIQALNLLNSTFVKQQAELLSARAKSESGDDLAAQVQRAFRLSYGRDPSASERAACFATAQEFGLAAVCRAIYNSNEFLFVP